MINVETKTYFLGGGRFFFFKKYKIKLKKTLEKLIKIKNIIDKY